VFLREYFNPQRVIVALGLSDVLLQGRRRLRLSALTYKPLNAHLDICFQRLEVRNYTPYWMDNTSKEALALATVLIELDYRRKFSSLEDGSTKELRHRMIGQADAAGHILNPHSHGNQSPVTMESEQIGQGPLLFQKQISDLRD
jgi:hypothetical protein